VSGGIVGLLLCANLINIGADLGAMGDSLKLLVGGPALPYVVAFGALSASLQIFVRYARYVSLLKWLCVSLFSYVICAFLVHVRWTEVGWALVWPSVSVHGDYLMAIVAVFGTTISPYLFFWQAGMEVEDEKASPAARPLTAAPEQAPAELTRIRIDTYVGMALSNLIALAIVITTAATLHARGTTDVQTSSQAAQALAAFAGPFAFVIFTAGIVGTGMLTLPVLAGSAAYALGEIASWRVGLRRPLSRARAFYGTIVVGMTLGVAFNFAGLNPIRALYWSAVLNGIAAVPVMAMMMRLASRRAVMADFTLPRWLAIVGWIATLVMALAVVALGISWM
jgi:Mn2+/Fe2+ NRAMP family transporter